MRLPSWLEGIGIVAVLTLGGWVWSMDEHKRTSEQILDSLQRDVRESENDKAARDAHEAAVRACVKRLERPYYECEELLRPEPR